MIRIKGSRAKLLVSPGPESVLTLSGATIPGIAESLHDGRDIGTECVHAAKSEISFLDSLVYDLGQCLDRDHERVGVFHY